MNREERKGTNQILMAKDKQPFESAQLQMNARVSPLLSSEEKADWIHLTHHCFIIYTTQSICVVLYRVKEESNELTLLKLTNQNRTTM